MNTAWTANFWLARLVLQSSTSMTAPAVGFPPRTLMQRPVLASLKKKLPVWTSGVMAHRCCALPLQLARRSPVPLAPAPASMHLAMLVTGDSSQPLPLAAITNLEVERPTDAFHC